MTITIPASHLAIIASAPPCRRAQAYLNAWLFAVAWASAPHPAAGLGWLQWQCRVWGEV